MSRRKKNYQKLKPTKEVGREPTYLKTKLSARTLGQKEYIKAIEENKLIICVGPAGSGKSHIAVAKAIHGLYNNQYDKIVITRPLVQAGEDTGFLPGDINNKLKPYLQPIYDEMCHYISFTDIKRWLNEEIIEIIPLAYMRGRNFHHSFVIADECQNASEKQLFMLVTRYCIGSKFVLTGDYTQSDIPNHKCGGLKSLASYITEVPNSEVIKLTESDIVRDQLVEDIVQARKEFHAKEHEELGT